MQISSGMSSTVLASHQAATAAAAQFAAQATTSAFVAQPTRFLSLDLAQSHNAVYQSLYNNAAAAAAAFQLSANSNVVINPFFNQFPAIYGNPADVLKNPFRSAFQSCASSASSSTSSATSANNNEYMKTLSDDCGNPTSNIIVIPEPKPLVQPKPTRLEEVLEDGNFDKSLIGFDLASVMEKNAIANLALLPKSNGIKIANGDYFLNGEMPTKNTLVTSSTCDSDGSSSSSSTFQNTRADVIVAQHSNKSNDTMRKSTEPSTTPITRLDKKRKEFVRDDAYWERRRKNNDAAKRSRDSRRRKEDEIAVKAAILEQENFRLRFEVERLKAEIEQHRLVAAAKLSVVSLSKMDENADPNKELSAGHNFGINPENTNKNLL